MAGAVGNYSNYVTQEQLGQIVDLIVGRLEDIGESVSCIKADTENMQSGIEQLKLDLQKVTLQYQGHVEQAQDVKVAKRESKMAIVAFISAIGSTVASAVAIYFLGLN